MTIDQHRWAPDTPGNDQAKLEMGIEVTDAFGRPTLGPLPAPAADSERGHTAADDFIDHLMSQGRIEEAARLREMQDQNPNSFSVRVFGPHDPAPVDAFGMDRDALRKHAAERSYNEEGGRPGVLSQPGFAMPLRRFHSAGSKTYSVMSQPMTASRCPLSPPGEPCQSFKGQQMSELGGHIIDDVYSTLGILPETEPETYRQLAQECREVWESGAPLRPWADQKHLGAQLCPLRGRA